MIIQCVGTSGCEEAGGNLHSGDAASRLNNVEETAVKQRNEDEDGSYMRMYVRLELYLYALLASALGREWTARRFVSFTLGTSSLVPVG